MATDRPRGQDDAPLFSVVTPVYDPPIAALRSTVESVIEQRFRDWELILVDDCSPNPQVREVLREYAARDPRIRVIERETNGHISVASNDGIAAARGEFIALLDHDDLLTRTALGRNAAVIRRFDDVDYLYSDEDHIDNKGRHFGVFRKPVWSPERMRAQNYCCHLSVLRTSLVRVVGGFREGFEGSQDHDLVLRVTEKARRIEHIPHVLYHWRAVPGSTVDDPEAKPYAFEAGRRAVQEHLERLGLEGEVTFDGPGRYLIKRRLPAERRVSIIIPTIGSAGMLWGRPHVMVLDAVRSALEHTRHENLEIVVVADAPTPPGVVEELRRIAGEKLVVVWFREPFNYSRKVNFGVLASTGDRIVMLNDDTQVISDDWVEDLLAPLEEHSVGATGAKLYYSNTTVQHSGLAFCRGYYHHPFRLSPRDDHGPYGMLTINREVSGLTGACMGIRRDTYFEVGGFSEELWDSFNDVDFSYKITAAGFRNVVVNRCELFHFETMTRKTEVQDAEYDKIRERWGRPGLDPYTPEFPHMPMSRAEHTDWVRRRHQRRKAMLGD